MSLTVHLALVFHVFIAVAVVVFVCGCRSLWPSWYRPNNTVCDESGTRLRPDNTTWWHSPLLSYKALDTRNPQSQELIKTSREHICENIRNHQQFSTQWFRNNFHSMPFLTVSTTLRFQWELDLWSESAQKIYLYLPYKTSYRRFCANFGE